MPLSSAARKRAAATLLEDFTGHKVKSIDTIKIPAYDTVAIIGKVDGIKYTTKRDGKVERYVHDFKLRCRPQLAISHDGQQIFMIGGSYLFKETGINDV